MILSCDLTWVFPAKRLAVTPSDAMKDKYSDKRSWWIDPAGKIIDVGHNHDAFLAKHPKIFGKWADIDKALTLRWIRVAFWGGEYVVHCHSITPAQVTAAQKIFREVPEDSKIYVSTLNKYGYIDREDFLTSDSQTDLMKALYRGTGLRASRVANESGSRAWLATPEGEIINCGRDHETYVKEHQDFLTEKGVPGLSAEELVQRGWARIGTFPRVAYMECQRLTRNVFDIFHDMVLHDSSLLYVQVIETSLSAGEVLELSRSEFLELDNPNQLRRLRRVGRRTASYPGRAWLMTPDGKVINCEYTHDIFIRDNQKLFKKMGVGGLGSNDLIRQGWARIGILSSFAFVDSAKVTREMLEVTQEILKSKCSLEDMKAGKCFIKSVAVNEAPNTWDVPLYEFIWLDRPEQVKREYRSSSRRQNFFRKRASLPDSRNFLKYLSLDGMSWPLQRAFDLLNLTAKKDEISANQVVSALRANEQLLEDKLGRTAVELIRDLNEFVQYDAPPPRKSEMLAF